MSPAYFAYCYQPLIYLRQVPGGTVWAYEEDRIGKTGSPQATGASGRCSGSDRSCGPSDCPGVTQRTARGTPGTGNDSTGEALGSSPRRAEAMTRANARNMDNVQLADLIRRALKRSR